MKAFIICLTLFTVIQARIVINFDDLTSSDDLSTVYSTISFHSGSIYELTAEKLGASLPYYLRNGTYFKQDIRITFPKPVYNLSFNILGINNEGEEVIRIEVIHSAGAKDTLSPIHYGSYTEPELLDLSSYSAVTEINIFDVTDYYGCVYDDFAFDTIPPLTISTQTRDSLYSDTVTYVHTDSVVDGNPGEEDTLIISTTIDSITNSLWKITDTLTNEVVTSSSFPFLESVSVQLDTIQIDSVILPCLSTPLIDLGLQKRVRGFSVTEVSPQNISLFLPTPSPVKIAVYNFRGQEIIKITRVTMDSGEQIVPFNIPLHPGIYLIEISSKQGTIHEKLSIK